jgi:hemolysin III
MTLSSPATRDTPSLDGPASETPERETAGLLYDSGRAIYYAKPLLRGWMHLVWFEVSLVLGTVLLATTHGTMRLTAVAIYSASVSGLFGVSALYHRGNWGATWSRRLQRLDHTMIFVMIAGSATPAFLISVHGTYSLVCVTVLWALTLGAVAIHWAWMSAPEVLVGATFIGLGWAAGLSVPSVWMHNGVVPAVLMIVGGLLYTAGAISYHRRRPDPSPSVFGYHEVFHAYVCCAAACQYAAVALFIV